MSIQDQDQEEIIDFLEAESAGFADQEEEETVEEQEDAETILKIKKKKLLLNK